jgi:hypothetical protein
MGYNFPTAPTPGQEFEVDGIVYVWNGYGWEIKVGGDAPEDGADYWRNNGAWIVGNWDALDEKPTSFPPGPHLHAIADVTGLQAQLDAINTKNTDQDATLTAKADKTYVDAQNGAQDTAIATKADKAYVDTQNAAQDTLIVGKADKTYVDAQNVAQDNVINSKEPAITPGTTGDYWRGDKTWQPLISGVTVSDNVPASALVNSLWWESDKGGMFLRYNDGSSIQWVQVNATGMPDAAADGSTYGRLNGAWTKVLPLTGGALSGHLTLPSGPGAAQAVRKDYVDAANATQDTTIAAKADKTYVDGNDVYYYNAAIAHANSQDAAYYNNAVAHADTKLPLAGGRVYGPIYMDSSTFIGGAPVTSQAANCHLSNAESNRVYRNNSSLRYKTAVETLEPEYGDKILGLRPVFYRSNDKTADDLTWSWFGFVAEEVDEVDFRFCGYTKDAAGALIPDHVHTAGVLAALVELVQRQEARIQALEAHHAV